jgi:uncharacterized hydrophobic protein (TIGR00271 family)
MTIEDNGFLGELRLGRRLTTTARVAVRGLAVILGLLFLVPSRIFEQVGVISAGASLLAVGIVGLTLLSVFELLGGSSERAGTYTLIHETLGGPTGFLAGWLLLAGSIALTAALLKISTHSFVLLFPQLAQSASMISLGTFGALVLVQLFHLLPRRELLRPVVSVLLLMMVIILLSNVIAIRSRPDDTQLPLVSGEFMRAVALSVVLYAGLEAILTSRRQIQDQAGNLPQGLIITLIFSGLGFASIQLLTAGIPLSSMIAGETRLLVGLASTGATPSSLVYGTASVAALLAANGCLMTAARQLYALSRRGALPSWMARIRPPFRVPPWSFIVLVVLSVPLLWFAPSDILFSAASGAFLIPMFMLNLAAIYSRRKEPDRRRIFVMPFYPLIPAISVAVNVALLLALPTNGLLALGGWFAVGLLIFFAYARTNLVEAQQGLLVFGQEPQQEKPEGSYRILVPLSAGPERHLMLGLATAMARQTGGELIPLQVIPTADPLAIEEGRRIARERNTLFQWSTRVATKSSVPTFPITRLARSVHDGILDTATEEHCDLIFLFWSEASAQRGVRMGQVLDPVIRLAPCDVAVVAVHPEHLGGLVGEQANRMRTKAGPGTTRESIPTLQIERILVPTAGGPHAPLATRLALLLARESNATTRVVYVADPQATEKELADGQARIQQTLTAMREQMKDLPIVDVQPSGTDTLPIESQVVTSDSVVDGIAQAGAESDLVFIGASEESLIDQVLLGTVPEQVARACPSPVLMVKRFRGLHRFWLQRLWNALFGALPTLSRTEQVEVYKQVRREARPDVDFFIMMGLSAVIATYGLLQDSAAVIIGAMLVAPLFTPILALSLAIVQGDMRLIWLAVEAALKGIALAIGIAVLLTAISPLQIVTHEISSRIAPNLFDLAVALASGAAGAYAVARKDVAAALPGVAIAAALVPPLGVVGVGMAVGDAGITWGGGLLFTTNLIAITLSSSLTLILLGFRPAPSPQRAARLRFGLVISLILLTAITIPLAAIFVGSVRESVTQQTIDQVLTQHSITLEDFEVMGFDFEDQGDHLTVTTTVQARAFISTSTAEHIREELSQALNRPVHLQVLSIPIMEIDIPAP